MSPPSTTDTPLDLDSLLTLEDTLYTTAYTLGTCAGSLAGRIEGRVFGLEKGLDKFAALGRLHGRSVVWGARALCTPTTPHATNPATSSLHVEVEDAEQSKALPPFPPNPRLTANITLLHALTDPDTFSTDNTEDGVADFDDRFKRAGAKAKVIERIVGESEAEARVVVGEKKGGKGGGGGKGDDSMEDFAGSRLVR